MGPALESCAFSTLKKIIIQRVNSFDASMLASGFWPKWNFTWVPSVFPGDWLSNVQKLFKAQTCFLIKIVSYFAMGVVLKSSRNYLLLLWMKNIEYLESSNSRACITGSGDRESQREKIENVFNFRKSFYFHFPSATTTTLSCLLFSADHITVCRWSNRAEHNDDDHHVDKDQNDWKNLHGSSLKGAWFIL